MKSNAVIEVIKDIAKRCNVHVDVGIGNSRVAINPYVNHKELWLKDQLHDLNIKNGFALTSTEINDATEVILKDEALWNKVNGMLQSSLSDFSNSIIREDENTIKALTE